jgi:autotransporter-associated beta strand protein
LSGAISGTDAFTKDGPGMLILTGVNTYRGSTGFSEKLLKALSAEQDRRQRLPILQPAGHGSRP